MTVARTAVLATAVAGLTVLSGCVAPAMVEGRNWVDGPQASRAATYPERALRQEVDGWAVLRCVAGPEHRVENCVLIAESPQGFGFGEIGLGMQGGMRAVDASVFHGHVPVEGEWFSFPVRFCHEGPSAPCEARLNEELMAFFAEMHPIERLSQAGRCSEAIDAAEKVGQPSFVRIIEQQCAKQR